MYLPTGRARLYEHLFCLFCIEKVRFGLSGRKLLDSFSRSGGKYSSNRKNRCRKICNSKPLSHRENPQFKISSQSTHHATNSAPIKANCSRNSSIDLLKGQSSSLQYVPAVARPYKIYKGKR